MGSSQFITRALLCLVSISLNGNLKVYGSTDSPLADVGPGIGEYEGVTSSQDLSAVYSLENGPTLSPVVEKAAISPTPQDVEEEITEEATTISKEGETVKADTSSNTTVFIIIGLFLLTNIIKGIPVIIGEVLMRRAQKTVDNDDFAPGTERRLENAESSNSIADTGIQMTVSYCNGKSMDSSINEIFIRGRESTSPEFSSGKETEEEILEDNPAYVKDSDENNFSSVNKVIDEENHVNGNKKSL